MIVCARRAGGANGAGPADVKAAIPMRQAGDAEISTAKGRKISSGEAEIGGWGALQIGNGKGGNGNGDIR